MADDVVGSEHIGAIFTIFTAQAQRKRHMVHRRGPVITQAEGYLHSLLSCKSITSIHTHLCTFLAIHMFVLPCSLLRVRQPVILLSLCESAAELACNVTRALETYHYFERSLGAQ